MLSLCSRLSPCWLLWPFLRETRFVFLDYSKRERKEIGTQRSLTERGVANSLCQEAETKVSVGDLLCGSRNIPKHFLLRRQHSQLLFTTFVQDVEPRPEQESHDKGQEQKTIIAQIDEFVRRKLGRFLEGRMEITYPPAIPCALR